MRDVRKLSAFLTYEQHMLTLPEAILQRAQWLPEGGILSPREFLHMGSRAAVDQAFSRFGESLASLRHWLPEAEWQALVSARATLPGWMAQATSHELARG